MTEEITTRTFDTCTEYVGLDAVAPIKVNSEGRDPAALRGPRNRYTDKYESIIEFQYNGRRIDGSKYQRHPFGLVEIHRCRLGKVTSKTEEPYPDWDSGPDDYVKAKYAACLQVMTCRIPSVLWWKSFSKGMSPC